MSGYTPEQRRAHAEQHIIIAAELGFLARTSCTHIANTYGVPGSIPYLRSLKKSLFPEFLHGDAK